MRSEGYSTLFVCQSVSQSVCVSDTTLQASVVKGTLKFRHQRTVNDTLQSFDSWILLTMLGSRDKAKFVSQEAYDRASLPETSAHVINHMLLLFVIEHVLFYQSSSVSAFSVQLVSSIQASLYATLVLVVVVWFILERQVVLVAMCLLQSILNKHLKAYTA